MRFNPFNPQQPARPDFFVGREPEIITFEKFLVQTMHNSPMNLSVTGNRGMGKTSLLMKFEQIAKENSCLVVRLSNYESNVKDIIDLCDFIALNIKSEILSKKNLESLGEWIKAFKPTLGWNDFTLTLEKKQVAQELFRQKLIKLWEEAKPDFKAIVLLIDEAESLEKVSGALTFLREVFQRISSEANYMVVLAGKLNFPERMSESFSPLNRFFPTQRLKSLSRQEMKEYLERKLKTENVEITDETVNYIVEKSEGHPYVFVAMCYLIFDSLGEKDSLIDSTLIERTALKIKSHLAKDFFSPMFHPLSKKAKEILIAICKNSKKNEFTLKEAIKWSKETGSYLSPYILELLRKGILNKPERATYRIFHTLFLEYVLEVKEG
ncbi:AAA family ATPase [Candidatus Woesearchaeota archaeon]|nr:AAA family ATPase [Candidatus Woesearchaeota archaeon]